MAKDDFNTTSRLDSVNEAYQGRVDNLEGADALKRDEYEEADKGLESVETPLPEEQRFVGNPDELRKDEDSEEKFSEGLKDNPVEVEVGGTEVKSPAAAKKTTAKKTAAKK